MKNPSGILLIGAGIFILALGFTGKFAEVWAVLKGGIPGLPGDGGGTKIPETLACDTNADCKDGEKCVSGVCRPESRAPGDGPGACPKGQTKVTVMTSAAIRCALNTDLAATENGNCRNGYVLVNRQNADGSATALCMKTVPSIGGGEQITFVNFPSRFVG